MSKSCRICDSVLSRTHYVALFSRESLASDLANRLSKVADVPVASEDGLSRFICIPCKNKLMSGEYFRTTAKATYKKNKDPTLIAFSSNSQVQVTNKRTKDSSGRPGASPQTRQCRPGAKQGRIQDFVLGGAYRDGNGGVPLRTCQGVWESAVSTIIPAPKP